MRAHGIPEPNKGVQRTGGFTEGQRIWQLLSCANYRAQICTRLDYFATVGTKNLLKREKLAADIARKTDKPETLFQIYAVFRWVEGLQAGRHIEDDRHSGPPSTAIFCHSITSARDRVFVDKRDVDS